MANKTNRKWGIIAMLLAVALLAFLAIRKSKSKPKGKEVDIEKVSLADVKETVGASGKIFPETEIKISSDVSGEIVELYVQEGDSVETGMVLAKIDPEAFISAVERGEASLNSTKSQLAISKAQIESNKAQKEQIMVQLENAKRIHARNEKLFKDGVISEADFEGSLTNLQQLEANLRSSEASLKSAQQNAKASEYTIKSSEASLKELKTSLNRTTIKAPTNGIVSALAVEKGERVVGTIQMAGTEMMRISNFNSMEVRVDVSENDILRVSVADEVDIEVDAYLDRKFKGSVTEIANTASNSGNAIAMNTDQVTNFIVKIRIDPNSYVDLSEQGIYPFRPGMSASVDIYTDQEKDALVVPIQAVTTRTEDQIKGKKKKKGKKDEKVDEDDLLEVVFVVDADTCKIVKVVTGIQDDENIVIKEGLTKDQEVVTGPYSAVSKSLELGSAVQRKNKEEESN